MRPLPRLSVLAFASFSLVAAFAVSGAPSPARAQSRHGHPGIAELHGRPTPLTTEYVIELLPGHTMGEVLRPGMALTDSIPAASLYLVRMPTPVNPSLIADSLSQSPAVDDADINTTQTTPEAVRQMVLGAVGGYLVDFTSQSTITRLRIDDAHHMATGAGQIVAVLDTGIDPAHAAFAGRVSTHGRDFVDGDYDPTETGNAIDDDKDGIVDGAYGHGTMVAGLVSLVAPDATLLPIRVLDDEGRGDAFTICQGIQYAVESGATVINMSFGATVPLPVINDQIIKAQALGVMVVAGAGNNNSSSTLFYPGAYPTTIMVTAVDSTDAKASFADYDTHITVSAPGTNLRSSFPGNAWAIGSGCSFATPLVAGEVALLRSANPALDWNGLKERVALGVIPIDNLPANANFRGMLGSGRVDMWQALSRSATAAGDPAASSGAPGLRVRAARGGVELAVHGVTPSHAARFTVLDAAGRVVRSWPTAETAIRWDGRDAGGTPVAHGVFFGVWRDGTSQLHTRFPVVR